MPKTPILEFVLLSSGAIFLYDNHVVKHIMLRLSGFKGRFCDKSDAEDMCGSAPCRFGTCVAVRSQWTCQCSAGYTGPSCDVKVSRSEIVGVTTVAPVQYVCPILDCTLKANNGRCDVSIELCYLW